MTSDRRRLTWLVADDFGGGVVSVAEGCARQASLAGHDATLLLALPPSGHATEFGGFRCETLAAPRPHDDIPLRLVNWLQARPQDVLLLNGCEQADDVIPYIDSATRVIYVVHDTAPRYWAAALRHEACLDAVIAVSETTASKFRGRMRDASKLHVVHNGTVIPPMPSDVVRKDDIVFVGGDKSIKGADDMLALWRVLQGRGFPGRLHWFGALSARFEREVARAPGAERIVIHGRQPRSSVFAVAATSKAMLMLSRVEPFGMSTIECMAMGCVPVAWDIETGTREIVAPGENAFAPLGDFTSLASQVERVVREQATRGPAAMARAREAFGEQTMAGGYLRVLDAVSHAPRSSRPMAGQVPPRYRAPRRWYQLLPSPVRGAIRRIVGRTPWLGYATRDLRGR